MATVEDFKLRFRVEGEADVTRVRKSISDLRTDIEEFAQFGGPFQNTINGIVGKLGLLGSAASIAGGAFVLMGAKAMGIAGDLSDLSGATGIAAGQLLNFKDSVIEAGGRSTDFEKIVVKLNQSVQEAAAGSGKMQEAFRKLGIDIADSNGYVKTTGTILSEITNKFQTGEITASQYSAAIDILGRSLTRLEVQKLKALTDTVTDEDTARIDKYNEKIDQLRAKLEKGIITFFGTVIEDAEMAYDKVTNLYNAIKDTETALNKKGKTGEGIFGVRDLTPAEKKSFEETGIADPFKARMRSFFGMKTPKQLEAEAAAANAPAPSMPSQSTTQTVEKSAELLASEKRVAQSRLEIQRQNQLQINAERLAASLQFVDQREGIELRGSAAIKAIEINRDKELADAKLNIYAQSNLTQSQMDEEYAAKKKEILTKAQADISAATAKTAEELAKEDKRLADILQTSRDIVNEYGKMSALAIKRMQMAANTVTATDREKRNMEELFNLEQERLKVVEQINKIKDLSPEQRAARELEINKIFEARRGLTIKQQAADKSLMANFELGFKKAFRQYEEDANNAFERAGRLFISITQGMEDAFVNFVKTGKFEWKGFVESILEELLRGQIKSAIASVLGPLGDLMGFDISGLAGQSPGGTPNNPMYVLDVSGGGAKAAGGIASVLGGGTNAKPASTGGGIMEGIESVASNVGKVASGIWDSVTSVASSAWDTVSSIGSAIGDAFGGWFANGGTLGAGKWGIAGEAGPELITGPATITPLNGGGTTNVTYNINAVDAMSFKALVAADPGFIHAVAMQGARSIPGRR